MYAPRFVGLLEDGPGDGVLGGKGLAHPDGLRALAGEHECDLHRGYFSVIFFWAQFGLESGRRLPGGRGSYRGPNAPVGTLQ
jgi:hypothetical protein